MTSKSNCLISIFAALSMALVVTSPEASLTDKELATLGVSNTPFTPLGAIREGNSKGTIPRWNGGLPQQSNARNPNGRYKDPFPDDKQLFTITAANYSQYADNLTAGQKKMFELYPDSFRMHVYPSRRSASYPNKVYEATLRTARTANLCGERCIEGTDPEGGIPFPIPKNGLEAMWNRSLYYQGDHFRMTGHGFIVASDGGYRLSKRSVNWNSYYYMPESERPKADYFTQKGGAVTCFYEENIEPPRSAGQLSAGCMYKQDLDADAYLYIPGQRRVRKAPDFGFYDQPSPNSDGLMTMDSRGIFMLTGSEEWYDYILHGKKELFVPYNSYQLAAETDFSKIIQSHHVNSDLIRYELHRVWEVEANVKAKFRHLSPHRFAYFDEDSWAGIMGEMYDEQGRLWRLVQDFTINYYDVPMIDFWGNAQYDLITGRYGSITAWEPKDFSRPTDWDLMTPQGLRKVGVR